MSISFGTCNKNNTAGKWTVMDFYQKELLVSQNSLVWYLDVYLQCDEVHTTAYPPLMDKLVPNYNPDEPSQGEQEPPPSGFNISNKPTFQLDGVRFSSLAIDFDYNPPIYFFGTCKSILNSTWLKISCLLHTVTDAEGTWILLPLKKFVPLSSFPPHTLGSLILSYASFSALSIP